MNKDEVVDAVIESETSSPVQEDQDKKVKYALKIAVMEDGAIDFTTEGEDAGLAEFLGLLKVLEITLMKKANEQLFGPHEELLHQKLNIILKATGLVK